PLTLSPGTAESSDYDSTSPVNLNINSGATEAEYTIQTYRDNDIEDETFTVELDTTNLPSGIVASIPISQEVTITDLDMPGISTPASVEFMEGDMTSFNVALTTQPSSDVTVTLTGHENTDLMLDLNVLTFTASNWDQEQTVTLTATEDTDLLDDQVTLTLSASGTGYMVSHTLTVTIQDNMGVATEQTEEAISLALWGNYPNPLSNSTKIVFDLPEPAQVSVAITDLLGRTVKMLPDKSFGVGTGHTLQINTGDLPSGAYFYTLKIVMDDKVVRRSKAMSIVR
ncbi:MAG: T9SS type A sorting domain-containing protein, partial [Rhodothermaceae bacterium]|nr:T9SS type A sorting domain-containing protein [Rhodothermaceae bacterium]